MFSKKKKDKTKNKQAIIKDILQFKKAARILEEKLEKEDLEPKEIKEIKDNIKNLYSAATELENATFRDVKKGMYLGLGINLKDATDNEIEPVYFKWDKVTNHAGVIGSSGVGKTVVMLSNIKDAINYGWNAVIVDPKGGNGQEIVNAVYSFCKEENLTDRLFYLSPAKPEISFLINPLYAKTNEEISSLFQNFIMSGNSEQFYGDMSYKISLGILTGLTYIEAVKDPYGTIKEEEIEAEKTKFQNYLKTNNIKEQIENEDIINTIFEEKYKTIEKEKIQSVRTLVTIKDIALYSTHEALVKLREEVEVEVPSSKLDKKTIERLEALKEEALMTLNDALKQEKEFFSKVSASFSTILTKLVTGAIGDIFCRIRINPMISELMAKDKRRFFLIVQPFPSKFSAVADVIVKLIVKDLEIMFGNIGTSEREIRRVGIFIDEAGSALYPGIKDMFNKIRGYGGTLFTYTQSYQDYYLALGEVEGKTVLDNINSTIRMRMNDIETAQVVVEEVGEVVSFTSSTIATTAANETRVVVSKNKEYVLSASDVLSMPVARGIVKHNKKFYLVDFAHYGKVYSSIKFSTSKFFEEMDIITS